MQLDKRFIEQIREKAENFSRWRRKADEHCQQQLRLGKTQVTPDDMLILDWWEQVALEHAEFPREFLRFIAIWEAFNGLLNLRLPPNQRRKKGDKNKVTAMSVDPNMKRAFHALLSDNQFNICLDRLRDFCPIYQVLGGVRFKSITIREPYDLKALLELIYEIRCNLFHGEKQLKQRDLHLTDLAYKILLPIYRSARKECLFTHQFAQTSGE